MIFSSKAQACSTNSGPDLPFLYSRRHNLRERASISVFNIVLRYSINRVTQVIMVESAISATKIMIQSVQPYGELLPDISSHSRAF